MCARLRLRAGQHEEQSHRLAVHRFIGHRRGRRAGDRDEIGEGGRLPVWNGYTIANAGWELPLSLHHRLQDIGGCPIRPDQQLHQFPQYALLALGPDGDPDLVGRKQFREPQWRVPSAVTG